MVREKAQTNKHMDVGQRNGGGRIESELGGVGRGIKHLKNKQKGIHEVHVVMSTKTQFCFVSREICLLGNAIMSSRFAFVLRSPPQAPPTNMINF